MIILHALIACLFRFAATAPTAVFNTHQYLDTIPQLSSPPFDDTSLKTCSGESIDDDKTSPIFNNHIIAGMNAYITAWSTHAHDSLAFQHQMVIAVRNFRLALALTSPASSYFDSTYWNLAVWIAHMSCREKVIDRYNIKVAPTWDEALRIPVRLAISSTTMDVTIQQGLFIECGVGSGTTLRIIDEELTKADPYPYYQLQLHGFDSFRGLPAPWGRPGSGIAEHYPRGKFDRSGVPPSSLPSRVVLHVGLVADTIPSFVQDEIKKMNDVSISFLHIDLDVYQSTFEALASFACLFVKGTVIQFDEALGYPEWKTSGEWKAFAEFVDLFGFKWLPVSAYKMRLSVKILDSVRSTHPACAFSRAEI